MSVFLTPHSSHAADYSVTDHSVTDYSNEKLNKSSTRKETLYENLNDLTALVADTVQDHFEQLQQYDDIDIKVNPPDPRLKLVRCEQPISVKILSTRATSRITSQVRCESQTPWSVYITSSVALFHNVVVATSPLAKGNALRQEDLELQKRDVSRLGKGFLLNTDSAIGMELRRPLRLGEPLRETLLIPPQVIDRGDTVAITAISQQVSVVANGTALSNGRTGDKIRVRNENSDRVVRAEVTGPGEVTIQIK
ncbi:flagellar basal body P-ring formation chaperone FlgA [Marinibactrum halimedae]|nr:flagellar basal body P-ring formation chaperone FlgA [Marinibactrum halimedae]